MDADDYSFDLGSCAHAAIVLDAGLTIVGANEEALQFPFEAGQKLTSSLTGDARQLATLEQCFDSAAKHRFQLSLLEGFDVEVVGINVAGPTRLAKLIALQFVDFEQARSRCSRSTKADQDARKIRALTRKNTSLEATIAARDEHLVEINESLENKVLGRTLELTQINEELEDLAYIVTHDLKVPINNLAHLARLLIADEPNLTEEQKDIVSWMEKNCLQATEKLESLVEVAQARSANLLPCTTIDLHAVANATCDSLKPQIDAKDAVVTLDFKDAPKIKYHPFESASLFENLLGNALKYAHPNRPPRVTLRSWKVADHVCVSVRDNGLGLNLPKDEKKVFGLFKRAHVTPPGNGIALYAIRKRLERYGGRILLDSVLGEWTEFTFVFPDIAKVQS